MQIMHRFGVYYFKSEPKTVIIMTISVTVAETVGRKIAHGIIF